MQLAGGSHALLPVHLHDAQPAGAQLRQVRVVAQMGNVDAVGEGGLQHVGALLHLKHLPIDLNVDVHCILPFLSAGKTAEFSIAKDIHICYTLRKGE